MSDFTKLSNLVDDDFTISKVWGYKFKKWDPESSKMLSSDTYQEGYKKVYEVDTDKGKLDLSRSQFGSLLENAFYKDSVTLIGRTFHVKSNGKTGMDIRYFFSAAGGSVSGSSGQGTRPEQQPAVVVDLPPTSVYDEGLPF